MRGRVVRRLTSLGKAFAKLGGLMLVVALVQIVVVEATTSHADGDDAPTEARAAALVTRGLVEWDARARLNGAEWLYENFRTFCTRQQDSLWFDCRYSYDIRARESSEVETRVRAGSYYCARAGCVVDSRLVR
jgi:hypothetical protein